MNIERQGILSFAGKPITVVGQDVEVGQKAPEFRLHRQDWSLLNGLEHTKGKVRIFASLPSINTSVCDKEVRKFNEDAASLGENIIIVTISADLPFAQKAWCASAGIERVMVASDHYDMDFGVKYGCLMKEFRLLRRAVFVVDAMDQVVYADYMPSAGDEPKYAEVLSVARDALKA